MNHLINTLLFFFHHRKPSMLVLVLMTGILGSFYSRIRDNQSVYEMLNVNDPADDYYINHYSPDFGKDDFLYVAFETPDPLAPQSFQTIIKAHEILEHLTIRFDPKTGKLFWAEDSERPLSEKIRHFLRPYFVDVVWQGNSGTLKPTRAELRKKGEILETHIKIEKRLEGGQWVGVIPVGNFVISLKNAFLRDPNRLMPLTVEEALWLSEKEGELTRDQIEDILLKDPTTGSILLSDIESYNPVSGEEVRAKKPRYTLLMLQLPDFRDRDELRQAVLAELRHQLKTLEAKTGHTGNRFFIAGIPALNAETTRSVSNDHFRREPLIFIFIILVLLILFKGQWRYLLLPLSVVLITLIWTLGLFQIFGGEFNWLTAVLPLILTVAGLSDSLHVLQFFEKEISLADDLPRRITKTVSAVWKPCLFTALTNIVGLVSLTLWKESPRQIQMFGVFGALGLLIALILTFVLFAVFLPYLPLSRSSNEEILSVKKGSSWEGFFERVFVFSRKHGAQTLAVFFLLTPLFVYGITRLEATVDVKNYFKKTTPIGVSIDFIDTHFRGLATYAIVLEGGDQLGHAILPPIPGDASSPELRLSLSAASLDALKKANACYRHFEYFEYPNQYPDLDCDWENFNLKSRRGRMTGSSLSILDFLPHQMNAKDPQEVLDLLAAVGAQNVHINRLIRFFFSKDGQKTQLVRLAHAESSEPIKAVNDRIVADIASFCRKDDSSQSCRATFSGIGQVWNQFAQKLTGFLKKSFSTAGFGVFLVMIVFFLPRLDLGFLSIIPNILPNIFILGFMGWLGIPLDMVTAMVGSVALGLIVDDSIHFLHVFREKVDENGDFDGAILHALKICGKTVAMASLILMGGFSILTIGDFMPVVQIGRLLMLIIACGALFEILLTPSLLLVAYKPVWRCFYKKVSK